MSLRRAAEIRWLDRPGGNPLPGIDHETIDNLLPTNYTIVAQGEGNIIIAGEDQDDETLDDVIDVLTGNGMEVTEVEDEGA